MVIQSMDVKKYVCIDECFENVIEKKVIVGKNNY